MIFMSSGSHCTNVKYGIFEFCLEPERVCFVGSFILVPLLPWLLPWPLPCPPVEGSEKRMAKRRTINKEQMHGRTKINGQEKMNNDE